MRAVRLVFGVVLRGHLLALPVGIVGDDQLHGVYHGAYPACPLIQVVPDGRFQQGHVVECVKLGVAYGIDEVPDALGGVSSAPHAA